MNIPDWWPLILLGLGGAAFAAKKALGKSDNPSYRDTIPIKGLWVPNWTGQNAADIERFIGAGINTLFVAVQDMPTDLDGPHKTGTVGHWGRWPEAQAILRRYKNDSRVKLILCPSISRHHKKLPRQFRHSKTPYLPDLKNLEYYRYKFDSAVRLANLYQAGLMFDMEQYSPGRDGFHQKSGFYSKAEKTQFSREVRRSLKKLKRKNFGMFPHRADWVRDAFAVLGKISWFLEERCYDDWDKKSRANIKEEAEYGYVMCGIWPERFGTVDKMIAGIEERGTYESGSGYWIWSPSQMLIPSGHAPNSGDSATPSGIGRAEFFHKLSELNKTT